MKTFLLSVVLALLLLAACKSKTETGKLSLQAASQVHQLDTANYTTINWLDTLKNIGTVPRGQKVAIHFRFRNTGSKPLFIADVRPSCGCTVADYTKGAVLPGQEGEVTGSFDSNHGYPGHIRKTMMVTSNTSNHPQYTLVFEGEVKQ